jgi:hypothetical protein
MPFERSYQVRPCGLPGLDRARDRFGANADVDMVYSTVTQLMQRTLDELAAERRFPVIG